MNLALSAAVFLTTALGVMAVYLVVADILGGTTGSRKSKQIPIAPTMDAAATLQAATDSLTPVSDTTGRWERFSLWVEQSGMRLNPATMLLMCGIAGTVSALIVGILLFSWWLPLVTFAVTAPLPALIVAFERYRRTDKLRSQLPDALDLMSRMLRAGQTIPQSLSGVADEFEGPIAEEFGYCYEQQNLGISTEAAMYEMARRTGVLELRILVVALTIHRQTGGNLSELLDGLAKVIRDRYRIQGQIKSLTADGRMQAAILLALPPILLIALSLINEEYVTILYEFPMLLVGMFGFELFGALWLHRIVSFDF